MRFTYCPDCGEKLTMRIIGDEGEVPYCTSCARPRFDMFSTCVITLVHDDEGRVALLRQGYISNKYRNLVSGYMKPGECAEETAEREVFEELGVRLKSIRLMRSLWFAKNDMLTDEALHFTNVFILFADTVTYESAEASEMVMDTVEGGKGYYITRGKATLISWQTNADGSIIFNNESGERITSNRGRSYIGFVKSALSDDVVLK